MNDRLVEWDAQKDLLNRRKHGLSLYAASFVFADPQRLEWFDVDHSEAEDRYKVLGRIGRVVFVVYTQRGDVTRLISARLATRRERRVYYEQATSDDF